MAYYVICPDCGAHNDPGEKCDCHDANATELYFIVKELYPEARTNREIFIKACVAKVITNEEREMLQQHYRD